MRVEHHRRQVIRRGGLTLRPLVVDHRQEALWKIDPLPFLLIFTTQFLNWKKEKKRAIYHWVTDA